MNQLTLPHRLWVAPMCQFNTEDGMPTDWHLVHLGSFAIGRAGLIMTEATAISPEGRISPQDTGIWNDAQANAWRRVVDFIHSQGVAVGIQLSHAGRKASTFSPRRGRGYVGPEAGGWQTVAPSALAYGSYPAPTALDHDGIAKVISDHVDAAKRAVEVGFDLIEIHAAHGYLLNQFLSPISNVRDDAYGGNQEGRLLLLQQTIDAVRSVMPAGMPLVVRLSATEWVAGGVTIDDTVAIVQGLRGVDLVSVSSGGNSPDQTITSGPGYQLPLARAVRTGTQTPVGAAGLVTTPEQAESAVVSGDADAVYVGRQFLREPTFALRAAAALGGELEWAPEYDRAKFFESIP